jgi:hypothetical protein
MRYKLSLTLTAEPNSKKQISNFQLIFQWQIQVKIRYLPHFRSKNDVSNSTNPTHEGFPTISKAHPNFPCNF